MDGKESSQELSDHIIVVGAILVDEDEKIFLFKRSKTVKHFPNLYEFPGGKLSDNETKKQALIRELKEEINIEVQDKDVISFKNNKGLFKNIELSLFFIIKWKNSIQINEKIHSKMIKINHQDLHYVNDLIENDKTFISAIQRFMYTEYKRYT